MYADLQKGQAPKTLVIGCCDSRVDPAMITNCNPGDIFVVRNVANIVPVYNLDHSHHGTSSAIEYAVKVLNVENIIVLGHSKCGGIRALMNNETEKFEFLKDWVEIVIRAKEKTMTKYEDLDFDEKCTKCGN